MSVRDLRQLRHFVAVAEELHFGRAAARLCITQPPLSQSIQALEQELGITLFHRTKRSVSLTPVGSMWLSHVRSALDQVNGLPLISQRLARGEIGKLRLSFVSSAVYSVLPDLISHYSQDFPEVEIVLQEATSDAQIHALLNDEADAGLLIAPSKRTVPSSLNYYAIQADPLLVALPEAWIQVHRKNWRISPVELRDVSGLPLILFPRARAPALHDLITDCYAQRKLQPKLGQRAIQMQTIIGLVSSGVGFALVPSSMSQLKRDGVIYRPLKGKPALMETGLVWRKNSAPPSVHHLIRLSKELFKVQEADN